MKKLSILTFLFLMFSSCNPLQKPEKSAVLFSDKLNSPVNIPNQTLAFSSPFSRSAFEETLTIEGRCIQGLDVEIYDTPELITSIECDEDGVFSVELNLPGATSSVEIMLIQRESPESDPLETAFRTFLRFNFSRGSRFENALSVLNQRCFECHDSRATRPELNFDYNLESDYIANQWVIPQDEHNSKLLNRTKFHNGVTSAPENGEDMPQGTERYNAFTQQEYNILKDWVLSMQEFSSTVEILSPSSESTVASTVVLSGSCEEGRDVHIFFGSFKIGEYPCEGNFNQLLPVTGPDGTVTFSVRQYDANEDIIGDDTLRLVKDTSSIQAVEIMSPAALTETSSELLIEGICHRGLELNFYIDGINSYNLTCPIQGNFQQMIILTGNEGTREIIISQVDGLGTIQNQTSRRFIKDSVAPNLSFDPTVPENGSEVLSSLQLRGGCETGLNINISGSEITNPVTLNCSNSQEWSYTVLFTSGAGPKEVLISSTDQAGNNTTISRNFQRFPEGNLMITSPEQGALVQSQVTLRGICTPNFPMQFSGNSNTSTTSTCPANGQFLQTLQLNVQDGTREIVVSQEVGIFQQLSAIVFVFKDTIAPNISITSPENNSETNGNVTVTGTCQAIDGNIIVSGTSISNSPLSIPCNNAFSFSTILSGNYGQTVINFSQTDPAGNSSTVSLTLNYQEPNPIEILSPVQDDAVSSTLRIQGTCLNNHNVLLYEERTLLTTTPCLNESFDTEVTLSVPDGNFSLAARLVNPATRDLAGIDIINLIKDTSNIQSVLITEPSEFTPTQGSLTLQGTCQANMVLRMSIIGQSNSAQSFNCSATGSFSRIIVFNGSDGVKMVSIEQLNSLGATLSSDERSFIKDTTPPTLIITSPAAGSEVGESVTVEGLCEDDFLINTAGSGITNPGQVQCNGGNWSASVNFTNGNGIKQFSITSADLVGNTSTVQRAFNRVPVGQLELITPVPGSHHTNSVLITGLCTPDIEIGFRVNVSDRTPMVCPGNGEFVRNLSLNGPEGNTQIIISQQVGSQLLEDSVSILKDTVGPNLQITSPQNGAETAGQITVQGVCEAGGSDIFISSSALSTFTSASCNSGSFFKQFQLTGSYGQKVITFRQLDLAMNETVIELTVELAELDQSEIRFNEALQVMVSSCFSCHSSGQYKFNFTTEAEFIYSGYAVPGDINASSVVSTVKYHNGSTNPNSQQSMPEEGYEEFTLDSYNKLKVWVENLAPLDPDAPSKFRKEKIANKGYIRSVMIDVFGPSAEGSTYDFIVSRSSAFSGPCDFYESSKDGDTPQVLSHACQGFEERTPSINDISLSVIGSANVLRSGWLINACEVMTENQTRMSFARNKAGVSSVGPTLNNISKAYELFYPGEVMPTELGPKLMDVANLASSQNDKWKNVFLTICLSPAWQIP